MSDGWIELTVACPSDDLAGLVAEGLVASGAGGVEELPGAVRAWIPADDGNAPRPHDPTHADGNGRAHAAGRPDDTGRDEPDVAALRAALESFVGVPVTLSARRVPAADWAAAWRTGLRPRRVGERIVVAPTWTQPELRTGDVLLSIDPEMAFGTGEHGTTRGMLRLLQQVECADARVLDVGTGSAILSIAAALLGAVQVDAVESDADALVNARDNVARHGVAAQVRLVHALADERWLAAHGSYDIILANILSGVIRPLLPAFRRALRPRGALLLSGILDAEAEDVITDAAAAGLRVRVEDLEDEWWSAWLEQA